VGPRYCPSIEDKVVRFADKDRHHIFLEPEGLDTIEVYPNGLSTSLPLDLQVAFVRSIPGLEKAEILRPGYAIEYDFAPPTQVRSTLETRVVQGLFLAGQINGTSGYEEAACQGLLAGANAVLGVRGADPLVLAREQSYAGVLVDDLITKGTEEPYRMMTSRSEHRLFLREDNADERLTARGGELGLVGEKQLEMFHVKHVSRGTLARLLTETVITNTAAMNSSLIAVGTAALKTATSLSTLLQRPEVTMATLRQIVPTLPEFPRDVEETIEAEVKYSGYRTREVDEANRVFAADKMRIPADFDYTVLSGLSREAREKLNKYKPENLGQASRISGITPAAINALYVHLH